MRPTRRTFVTRLGAGLGAGLGATLAAPAVMGAARGQAPASALPMTLNGAWRQGGFVLGRTAPRAMILVDGEALTAASAAGLFVLGFDRDATGGALIEARSGERTARRR